MGEHDRSENVGGGLLALWEDDFMEVETDEGTEYVEAHYVALDGIKGKVIREVAAKHGYLVQWTMPGFMDCSDLIGFESLKAAQAYFEDVRRLAVISGGHPMDPQATLTNFFESVHNGDLESADEYRKILVQWINKGGFVPVLTGGQLANLLYWSIAHEGWIPKTAGK